MAEGNGNAEFLNKVKGYIDDSLDRHFEWVVGKMGRLTNLIKENQSELKKDISELKDDSREMKSDLKEIKDLLKGEGGPQ